MCHACFVQLWMSAKRRLHFTLEPPLLQMEACNRLLNSCSITCIVCFCLQMVRTVPTIHHLSSFLGGEGRDGLKQWKPGEERVRWNGRERKRAKLFWGLVIRVLFFQAILYHNICSGWARPLHTGEVQGPTRLSSLGQMPTPRHYQLYVDHRQTTNGCWTREQRVPSEIPEIPLVSCSSTFPLWFSEKQVHLLLPFSQQSLLISHHHSTLTYRIE